MRSQYGKATEVVLFYQDNSQVQSSEATPAAQQCGFELCSARLVRHLYKWARKTVGHNCINHTFVCSNKDTG